MGGRKAHEVISEASVLLRGVGWAIGIASRAAGALLATRGTRGKISEAFAPVGQPAGTIPLRVQEALFVPLKADERPAEAPHTVGGLEREPGNFFSAPKPLRGAGRARGDVSKASATPGGVCQGVGLEFCPIASFRGFGKGCEAEDLIQVTWAGCVPVSASGGLGPRADGRRHRPPAAASLGVVC